MSDVTIQVTSPSGDSTVEVNPAAASTTEEKEKAVGLPSDPAASQSAAEPREEAPLTPSSPRRAKLDETPEIAAMHPVDIVSDSPPRHGRSKPKEKKHRDKGRSHNQHEDLITEI
jgi:hypothetical protein